VIFVLFIIGITVHSFRVENHGAVEFVKPVHDSFNAKPSAKDRLHSSNASKNSTETLENNFSASRYEAFATTRSSGVSPKELISTEFAHESDSKQPAEGGTVFSVSPVINVTCASLAKSGTGEICDRVMGLLSLMAKEKRNDAWAPQAEYGLQKFAEAQAGGQFSVRNIECRSSLCAIEVVSLYGQYFTGPAPYRDPLNNLVGFTGLEVVGTEKDADGIKVFVTLLIYKRNGS